MDRKELKKAALKAKQGFTLIEIMVVVGIIVVTIIACVNTFGKKD